jgi:hypothetical protein
MRLSVGSNSDLSIERQREYPHFAVFPMLSEGRASSHGLLPVRHSVHVRAYTLQPLKTVVAGSTAFSSMVPFL